MRRLNKHDEYAIHGITPNERAGFTIRYHLRNIAFWAPYRTLSLQLED